jgi:NADH:ubiquinone oxidoreductase subunit E
MRQAHRVLAEFSFDSVELSRGYANRTLRIDVGQGECAIQPVTQQMKDLWTGGKGFDLWLMFQEIHSKTDWDSPENPICFSPGPLGGLMSFPGSGKTLVTTISPSTHSVMDCNVGGHFGPYLKFTGFDALCVVGKASEEVIVYIDGVRNRVTIEAAPLESIDSHVLAEELTAMYAEDEMDRRNISVVSAGRGAQHTKMGVLNFSFWDWRRNVARLKQAGRGGIGSVFREKKIKALVIRRRGVTPAWTIEESKVAHFVTPDTGSTGCGCRRDELEDVRKIAAAWGNDPEYVIEMMQDVQDSRRCISNSALDELCRITGTPKARLYHIATFYKAFSLKPRGETVIQVCMGTACHVKGAARIVSEFERHLGISQGQTTPDGKYTLEAVACLGACSIAPVVKVGDEVMGNVQAQDVGRILSKKEG